MFDATPIYETKCLTTKPENVRKLIAWLREGRGPGLNMGTVFGGSFDTGEILKRFAENNWCDTTACIWGHSLILARIDGWNIEEPPTYDIAARYLGISAEQQNSLFGKWTNPCSIPEAIGKLEALLEPV